MSTPINSKDWVLAVKDGSAWEPIVCLKSRDFDAQSNQIEVKTFCNDDYATLLNGSKSWTMKCEGVAINDGTSGEKSWVDLLNAFNSDTTLEVRFGPATPSATEPLIHGFVKVGNFALKNAVDAEVSFTCDLRGQGAFDIVTA